VECGHFYKQLTATQNEFPVDGGASGVVTGGSENPLGSTYKELGGEMHRKTESA
jgi:hypothetical protein